MIIAKFDTGTYQYHRGLARHHDNAIFNFVLENFCRGKKKKKTTVKNDDW